MKLLMLVLLSVLVMSSGSVFAGDHSSRIASPVRPQLSLREALLARISAGELFVDSIELLMTGINGDQESEMRNKRKQQIAGGVAVPAGVILAILSMKAKSPLTKRIKSRLNKRIIEALGGASAAGLIVGGSAVVYLKQKEIDEIKRAIAQERMLFEVMRQTLR